VISESQQATLISTVASLLNLAPEAVTDDTSTDTVPAWDSVTHLNLVIGLEEALGVAFSPEETVDMTSVKMIRLILEEKLAAG
jgi:acyl carrier protein